MQVWSNKIKTNSIHVHGGITIRCSDHKTWLTETTKPDTFSCVLDKSVYETWTGQRKLVLVGKESKQGLGLDCKLLVKLTRVYLYS